MNGCHNRPPYHAFYMPTGFTPEQVSKRIPHTLTKDCQYTHTSLGQADPGCTGCKHRKEQPNDQDI